MTLHSKTYPRAFRCFEVFVSNRDEEIAYAVLERLTQLPVTASQIPGGKKTKLIVYFSSKFNVAQLAGKFKKYFRKKCLIRAYDLKDWQERWKKNFHAKKISRHLWICPSWEKVKLKRGEKVILLEPGLAFGTGLHPTTGFTLKMIDRFHQKIKSLADLGAGSGVLSIGASRLGVRRIVAIDIDPNAIQVSKENFKRNRCKIIKLFCVAINKFRPKERFDFVAANIETNVLMKSKNRLLKMVNRNGWLVITGIGSKFSGDVLRYYQSKQLNLVAQFKGKEWCGFCFQKR